MAHEHPVIDQDKHFVIDPITRKIKSLTPEKNSLVRYDHNSERFTFEIPRYVDGHDMSLCNIIQIHYINIANNKIDRSANVYETTDMYISDDNNSVIFSWLISANATQYYGSLSFAVRFACTTEDVIDYDWHTDIYSGINISDSINNGSVLLNDYLDILEAWKLNIGGSGDYMTKTNPVGTGSFSMNRKENSTIGDYSFASGYNLIASGVSSHAEGACTTASGTDSHAEGSYTTASETYSHAEGHFTEASGVSSHAEGHYTDATGDYSHAEGHYTEASGTYSHAEGRNTKAIQEHSHAEGYGTIASGGYSHAEGSETTASGFYSHSEGTDTTASGDSSHAEGWKTTASGTDSHAEGNCTIASGKYSHAEGSNTTSLANQHAQGHYNNTSTATKNADAGSGTGTAFVIGNGTSASRSNAFRVTGEGKVYASNAEILTGADYAEYFEWADGNQNGEDRVGHFVTFDENNPEKIRIANLDDDYILGVISGMPNVIGNGDEDWKKRYILDDFGRYIEETFEYETTEIDKETGEETTVTKTGTKWKENPDYDNSILYTPRDQRPEWSAVGMLGVLSVYDDGTCKVNGYCKCSTNGIATASEKDIDSYRIIARVTDNIVKIVFR